MNDENNDTQVRSDSPKTADREIEETPPEENEDYVQANGEGQTIESDASEESESERYEELYDRYLRLQAEFDNYRKRMNARFDELAKYASEAILLKFLDVVDNLERALETDFDKDPSSAKEGVEAIYKQIQKILQSEDVRAIESLGKEFDPYYQNAINTINDASLPDREIVKEYQKGYMLRDKVLRPAVVCVNRHLEETTETTSDPEEQNEEVEGDVDV